VVGLWEVPPLRPGYGLSKKEVEEATATAMTMKKKKKKKVHSCHKNENQEVKTFLAPYLTCKYT